MANIRVSMFLVFLAVAAAYCKAPSKISAEEARKMMLELKEYTLLDVRTEAEFKEERIKGAVLIPDYELKQRAVAELPDKNQVILIYCRSGKRSAKAAAELADLGYAKVYDFGGIIDWSYEWSYETESE